MSHATCIDLATVTYEPDGDGSMLLRFACGGAVRLYREPSRLHAESVVAWHQRMLDSQR